MGSFPKRTSEFYGTCAVFENYKSLEYDNMVLAIVL
jgi:hypothetical protein